MAEALLRPPRVAHTAKGSGDLPALVTLQLQLSTAAVLTHRQGITCLRAHCSRRGLEAPLLLWLSIEQFRRVAVPRAVRELAEEIWELFLRPSAEMFVDIDSGLRSEVERVLHSVPSTGHVDNFVFNGVQSFVLSQLMVLAACCGGSQHSTAQRSRAHAAAQGNVLPTFVGSPEYTKLLDHCASELVSNSRPGADGVDSVPLAGGWLAALVAAWLCCVTMYILTCVFACVRVKSCWPIRWACNSSASSCAPCSGTICWSAAVVCAAFVCAAAACAHAVCSRTCA